MFKTHEIKPDLNKTLFRAMNGYYRKYHNVRHVKDILHLINDSTERYSDNKFILDMAAYFHDIVYMPGSKENEILSAKFFMDNFDHAEQKTKSEISDIILATQDHFSEENDESCYLTKLFLDLDIWDMGSKESGIMQQNYKLLLNEYMFYHFIDVKQFDNQDMYDYSRGTISFMEKIYNKKEIFRVNTERNDTAHHNIERLLKYLNSLTVDRPV